MYQYVTGLDEAPAHSIPGPDLELLNMKLNCIRVLLIGAALLLGACSSATHHSCYSDACRLGGGMARLNVNGNAALGNSFNQYGASLLDD